MSLSSSSVYFLYARSILTRGTSPSPTGTPTSAVDVRADLKTSHEEPAPRDEQLEAATTSTAGVGTHTHQVRLIVKTADTPRKASGKGKSTLQSPICSDPPSPSQ
jgi:hypothetical protein